MRSLVEIRAKLVPETERFLILPRYVGYNYMIDAEAVLYAEMSRLSADYVGAYWRMFELSNRAFFMSPQCDTTFSLRIDSLTSVEVDAETAGLAATVLMLRHLRISTGAPRFMKLHKSVFEYAATRSDADLLRQITSLPTVRPSRERFGSIQGVHGPSWNPNFSG